jgi:hypothetical protein
MLIPCFAKEFSAGDRRRGARARVCVTLWAGTSSLDDFITFTIAV